MSRSSLILIVFVCAGLFMLSGCKKEAAKCGNGVVEGSEVCDEPDFAGDNCQKHGFRGGSLECFDCTNVNFEECSGGCGNGKLEQDLGEECDRGDFGGDNCEMHGYDYGTATCSADCTFDESSCRNAVCGNGNVEDTEKCEPDVEHGKDCGDFDLDAGEVSCYPPGSENECHFDISGCVKWECGNGVIDPGEDCDFDSEGNEILGDTTCETLGYDGGSLVCVPADHPDLVRRCGFDVSGCATFECGNGIVEGTEECEPDAPITATCMDRGFEGGTLGCKDDGSCMYDLSGCTGGCGNGVKEVEIGEECDGEDLGGETCESVSGGDRTGRLRCKSDCTYDLTLCVTV